MQKQTCVKKKYFLALMTAAQPYVSVHLLNAKYNVEEHCFNFVALLERNAKRSVKRFHSDNITELLSLRRRFGSTGITSMTSSSYTPQSNGFADRMNHTLLDRIQTMLHNWKMISGF